MLDLSLVPFGEHPEAVPQVVPDSKEARGDKVTDVRTDAHELQAIDDEVIQHEIN